eukprot:g81680.t1
MWYSPTAQKPCPTEFVFLLLFMEPREKFPAALQAMGGLVSATSLLADDLVPLWHALGLDWTIAHSHANTSDTIDNVSSMIAAQPHWWITAEEAARRGLPALPQCCGGPRGKPVHFTPLRKCRRPHAQQPRLR